MKKCCLFFSFMSLVFIYTNAYAFSYTYQDLNNYQNLQNEYYKYINLKDKHKTKLQLTFETYAMDYREYDDNGNILDSEKSEHNDIHGFGIKWEEIYLKKHYSYKFIFNGKYLNGNTQYVGSYIGDPNAQYGDVVSTTKNRIWLTELLFGYENNYLSNMIFGIDGGVGYRKWERKLSSTQQEDYKWFYYKLSPYITFNIYNFTFGYEYSYKKAFDPKMEYIQGKLTFDLGDVETNQHKVFLNYKLNNDSLITIQYYREYIDIDKSNVIYLENSYVWEPSSRSVNEGIKAGFVFVF